MQSWALRGKLAGYTRGEMAEQIGVTPAAIKMRMYRGRKKAIASLTKQQRDAYLRALQRPQEPAPKRRRLKLSFR